jgi:hypothetical protein
MAQLAQLPDDLLFYRRITMEAAEAVSLADVARRLRAAIGSRK